MTDGIELTIDGPVARVVLNAPGRRNAFDSGMLAAYEDAILTLERARGVEIAVLTGTGPAFCSGTDLKELATFDANDTLHIQKRTGRAVERWVRLEATTITAFNGPAIGSGAIIGLASDFRIASGETVVTFPEVGLGIPLTWSGVPILVALLGPDRARRVIMLGEPIDTDALVDLDLVMQAVPSEDLAAATEALVGRLRRLPHIGRLMTKRAVQAAVAAPGLQTNEYEPFLASLSIHARGGDF
jgi:enoyl-CoA hydratase/carnithine racemase